MRKFFNFLMLCSFLAAFSVAAAEIKNIAYYEKDFPRQGNIEALQERCKLDLKTPDTKNFPVLIWFHGGGLSGGEKFYPEHIDTSKIAIAAVNYRLSGKNVQHPDYIYDAAAAVAWVLKNIRSYGGDPAKVFVSGHSAGGYLAAMIALDKKYLNTFGFSPEVLAGVYPISGQMSTHFKVLGERRKKNPATPEFTVDEYAPLFHASVKAPPMILFCGDPAVDWPARVEENQLLAARLKYVYKHKKIKMVSIPNTGHVNCRYPALSMINNILSKLKK